MKTKLIFIICIMYAFFVGVCGTVVLANKNEKVVPTINEINELNSSINSSIDKIYNAVLLIENFKKNTLSATGTGFVYKQDDKGYVITNYHVIDGFSSIKVVNMSGIESDATLLGYDEYLDIAVLSVPLENVMMQATIGDSTKLSIGDTLFTVGSPLGIEYMGTVTKGILSGINRQVAVTTDSGNFLMDVLQTDAAINPGNSGGPLVNDKGEVIGVTSMKLVKDEIEGMGFAIPIELVTSSVDKLEKGKKIERPYLGIEILDMSDEYLINRYDININTDLNSGVVIMNVDEGSIGSKYNLKKGDVITYINSDEIKDTAHFKYILYKYNVGDTIKLKYIRDSKETEIEIKL